MKKGGSLSSDRIQPEKFVKRGWASRDERRVRRKNLRKFTKRLLAGLAQSAEQ